MYMYTYMYIHVYIYIYIIHVYIYHYNNYCRYNYFINVAINFCQNNWESFFLITLHTCSKGSIPYMGTFTILMFLNIKTFIIDIILLIIHVTYRTEIYS